MARAFVPCLLSTAETTLQGKATLRSIDMTAARPYTEWRPYSRGFNVSLVTRQIPVPIAIRTAQGVRRVVVVGGK